MANSYLISEIIKNNLVDSFYDYLNGLIKINEEKINDVNLIFNEEEYIYFPKLTDEDIIYCFIYGYYNYKCGALNPTKLPVNLKDNENDKINREKILINLKENFKKEKIKDNHLKLLDGYFSKINHLYNKIEKLKYAFDINWLRKPLESLKNEAIQCPNRILIKADYEKSKDFDKIIFDGEKILVKAIKALLEGNKILPAIKAKIILNDIISDLKQLKQQFQYGYRIMEFYDFHLFEDNQSKTMILIIETINNFLNTHFGSIVTEDAIKEINNILRKIYKELIILLLSFESQKFETTEAVHIFEILYNSFYNSYLARYINIYEDYQIKFKEDKKSFFIF